MKNTTLRQLVVFETVARLLHYTRAAQELGMTQPSVSIQVRQFEDTLGVTLFEQIGKRTFLTEAGREMHRFCREITRQLTEAETVLERFRGGRGGQLRIGIAPTAKYFVPAMLEVFRRDYPDVTFNLTISGHEALLAQFEEYGQDMAIMGPLPEDSNFVATPFRVDPLVVIAASTHPLVGKKAVSLERMAKEPILMREPSSDTRGVIEQFFTKQGIQLKPSMVINSNEAIKKCVQAGLGLAIVPYQSVTLELEVGCLATLDIEALTLQRSWYLVHRHDKRFSFVAEAFKNFVLEKPEATVV